MSITRSHSRPAPATERAQQASRGRRLFLVGHGSTRAAEDNAALLRHGERLAARALFDSVDVGLLYGEPSAHAVAARLPRDPLYVVPIFMAGGHYPSRAIPALFGRDSDAPNGGGPIFCQPVGLHPRLADIVVERAIEALEVRCVEHARDLPSRNIPLTLPSLTRWAPPSPPRGEGTRVAPRIPRPSGGEGGAQASQDAWEGEGAFVLSHSDSALVPRDTTLLVVGHGSRKSDASWQATEAQAKRMRDGGLFRAVTTAYLEQNPALEDVLRQLDGPIVAAGLFAGEGAHAARDVPELLEDYKAGPVVYLGAMGADPLIADLVLDQVAAADPDFRR